MTNQLISSVSFIRCDGRLIARDAIIWLEGDCNYTRIYEVGQPARLSARTLKWYESMLAGFIRIHRGAMVNPAYIQSVQRDEDRPDRVKITLYNGESIGVARRRLAAVKLQLKFAHLKRFGQKIDSLFEI